MAELQDIIRQSRKLEPQSRAAYLAAVARFERFAPSPLIWTPQTVERWRDALSRQGLSAQTVNKHLYALRYATRRREALGRGTDFARSAETVKTHARPRRRALELDVVEAMLATTAAGTPRDLRDRAFIILGVKTGLRVTAMVNLNWDDIDRRSARVREKGGHTRLVALETECLEALRHWRKVSPSPHTGPVFIRLRDDGTKKTRRRGPAPTALSRQGGHAIVSERAVEAGIREPVHPHLLRHTFVTWALAAGVPPQRVMAQTGHKNMATLSGYVTDLDAERDPVGAHLPSILKGKK